MSQIIQYNFLLNSEIIPQRHLGGGLKDNPKYFVSGSHGTGQVTWKLNALTHLASRVTQTPQ